MTEEQIKELLSRHYVSLIGSRTGFTCTKPDSDYGVDLYAAKVEALVDDTGKIEWIPTGHFLNMQLKASCERVVSSTVPDHFGYQLPVRAYNQLARWWASDPATPFYLIVFLLPDDPAEWLKVTPLELALRKSAYWYRTEPGAVPTQNTSTITIQVSHVNRVGLNFMSERCDEFYT